MEHLLEIILRVIWWPYQTWQQTNENSRIGTSELDREAARFWQRIALTCTVVVLVAAALASTFLL